MDNFSSCTDAEMDRKILKKVGWSVQLKPALVPDTSEEGNAGGEREEMLFALISPTGEIIIDGRVTEEEAWEYAPKPTMHMGYALELVNGLPDTVEIVLGVNVRVESGSTRIWSNDRSRVCRAMSELWWEKQSTKEGEGV